MDVFPSQTNEVDMTKTGRFCIQDGKELEQVSMTNVYVCHWCGGQYIIDSKNGKVSSVSIQFEGT